MSFQHYGLNRFSVIAGIVVFLVAAAAAAVQPASTAPQLSDSGIVASGHVVNRALKADRVMVAKPPVVVEPETKPAPRPDLRNTHIKIGCERPFSAMVSKP